LAQMIVQIRCPFCGSTDVTYNPSNRTVTCNSCGISFSIAKHQATGEAVSSESIIAETSSSISVVKTEEVGFRRVTQEIFPHTHIEFKTLQDDIEKLKNRVTRIENEIEKLSAFVPKEIIIEEVPIEEAKRRVVNFLREYFKTHEYVYPSDVAEKLGLKYELVREVFDLLEKEGKLEKKVT